MATRPAKRRVYTITAIAITAALGLSFFQLVLRPSPESIEGLAGGAFDTKWWPVWATFFAGIALVAISLGDLLAGSTKRIWELTKIGVTVSVVVVTVLYSRQLVLSTTAPDVAATPSGMTPVSSPQ